MELLFVESPTFSKQIDEFLDEEGLRQLQLSLLERPDQGEIIKGSGGLRKMRWSGSGKGKRGGIRIIYYLWHEGTAFMLFAYPKKKQNDLTSEQLKVLKSLIEEYTNE